MSGEAKLTARQANVLRRFSEAEIRLTKNAFPSADWARIDRLAALGLLAHHTWGQYTLTPAGRDLLASQNKDADHG